MNLNLAEIRKWIVAVAGALATILSQGLVSGATAQWVAVVLSVATAVGVYVVPNDKPKASPAK